MKRVLFALVGGLLAAPAWAQSPYVAGAIGAEIVRSMGFVECKVDIDWDDLIKASPYFAHHIPGFAAGRLIYAIAIPLT